MSKYQMYVWKGTWSYVLGQNPENQSARISDTSNIEKKI